MLSITVPGMEYYNEQTETFETKPDMVLQLEHSLISLSKWESKWKKSFLSSSNLTPEQLIDYVRCMTINKISDETVYARLTTENFIKIRTYIDDPMTATTINRQNKRPSRKIVTSEQIYGWMVGLGIPFECEKWHLSRLLMLIEVCSIQQNGGTGKKMSPNERAQWQALTNAKRRAKTGSRG